MKTVYLIVLTSLFYISMSAQQFEWARSIGGSTFERGYSITTDLSGNVITTGLFKGSVDFDPGAGQDIHISNGDSDIFIQKMDSSGSFQWAQTIGGTSWEHGYEIITDTQGNIIVTGVFNETVDFDPGANTTIITSEGAQDSFILKLTPSGDLLWVHTFGSSETDDGNGLAVDTDNNIYLTGMFKLTVDFDPGINTHNLISMGDTDIYILKLNPNGDFIWAKSFGGFGFDRSLAIEIDLNGDLITTGFFSQTVDFDPGTGTYFLTANGLNPFIQKLNSDGEFIWARSITPTTASTASAHDLDSDSQGNVYITGTYTDTADFDPGQDDFLTSNGNEDAFILKLDADGNFLWANSVGGASGDIGNSISVDLAGNVITTGFYHNTVDFNPNQGVFELTTNGSRAAYIQILDTNGEFINAFPFDGTSIDEGEAMTIDTEGNLYFFIRYGVIVDFDPGSGVYNLTANGFSDLGVLKLSPIVLASEDFTLQGVLGTLYPNPTNGIVTVMFGKEYKDIQILITNAIGQTIINKVEYRTRQFEFEINGTRGIYFCKVIVEGNISYTYKILKQ